jgi:hypothetical protein
LACLGGTQALHRPWSVGLKITKYRLQTESERLDLGTAKERL